MKKTKLISSIMASSVDYGFAVNKGKNADLLKKFNEGLNKIKENGKYDEIVNQYIGK